MNQWDKGFKNMYATKAMDSLKKDAAKCVSYVKWEDRDYLLPDFIDKYELPQVAKITCGYLPNFRDWKSLPKTQSQFVLLMQKVNKIKVCAQFVQFHHGRQEVIGPNLAIPNDYEGWFEILSENGKSSNCTKTLAEIVQMKSRYCLVRQDVKAYLPEVVGSKMAFDKKITVRAGETLRIIKAFSFPEMEIVLCITQNAEKVYIPIYL